MSKTFCKVMKKYGLVALLQQNISRIEGTIYHSQACVPCVKDICREMDNKKVLVNDK